MMKPLSPEQERAAKTQEVMDAVAPKLDPRAIVAALRATPARRRTLAELLQKKTP
jgi:hypothetical protein